MNSPRCSLSSFFPSSSSFLSLLLLLIALYADTGACVDVPEQWRAKEKRGDMLISTALPESTSYVPQVGNGYVAAIPTSDTMYISGLFNGRSSITPSHRAKVPFPLSVSAANSDAGSSVYALDVREAAFLERFTVGSGASQVELRWFAPYQDMHAVCLEIEVTPSKDRSATLELSVPNKTSSSDIDFSVISTQDIPAGTSGLCGTTKVREDPGNESSQNSVAVVYSNIPRVITVPAGTDTATFRYFVVAYTTLDTPKDRLISEASREYKLLTEKGDTVFISHKLEWEQIWDSGIEVGGGSGGVSLDLAQGVNSSLYYILSSIRPDWPYGLSPGSLSSNSYNGHSFWDTETWMFPTLALLHPSFAASLLEYRIRRLSGAYAKAKSYDPPYSGAMYPWESALTGIECTPVLATTGHREIHISGDISLAAQQYWNMTLDKAWLAHALPMLTGIADFWVSKAVYHPESDEYWITNVVPPDEFSDHKNNSVYTNSVARISLNVAMMSLAILGQGHLIPSNYSDIAAKLRVPFDETKRIHPEYDGYGGHKIKQADVVLLGYPLEVPMPADVRGNDLAYYAERTYSKGPAMTYAMHAVGWLELREEARAAEAFNRSHANMRPPFKVWAETPSGGAVNFITGAGGFLQALWAGYMGVRIRESGFVVRPALPVDIGFVRVRGIRTLGAVIDVSFDGRSVEILMRGKGSSDLCVGEKRLDVGAPLAFEKDVYPQIEVSRC